MVTFIVGLILGGVVGGLMGYSAGHSEAERENDFIDKDAAMSRAKTTHGVIQS